jgi:hypothetical protein
MGREKRQISKIRNEKGVITANTKEIQGIIRDHFENYIPKNWKILKKWKHF